MTIKDPQIHAMARKPADRQGTSLTYAVRQALRANAILPRSPLAGSTQQGYWPQQAQQSGPGQGAYGLLTR